MKILEITSSICHYVHIECKEWDSYSYRRNGVDCWEVLMGESWESVYDTETLEEAFQKEMESIFRTLYGW